MKRHIPGLHARQQNSDSLLEGLFLVRVDSASYRWHPHKPFLSVRFVVLEPEPFAGTITFGSAVLHRTSAVEAELVPARFRL